MADLELTPLPLDSFSGRTRKAVDPASPKRPRLMAARGALPMGPVELVMALYQLTFDPDEDIRESADETLACLDDELLPNVIADTTLDPRVLDRLARARLIFDDDLLERFVTNQAVADETITHIASLASERITEIIAGIHVRLLRTPAIIEALFENSSARQSTLDKVLDLAQREGVKLPRLSSMQAALAAVADDDEPGLDEEVFQELLAGSVDRAAEEAGEEQKLERYRPGKDDEEEDKVEEEKVGVWKRIQLMNASQKIRLASVGGREERGLLVRDSKRVVYMAAISSPKVAVSEAQMYAKNRALSVDVITYIANKREWIRYYPLIVCLVNNPKCPPSISMAFIKQLRTADLRGLMRNKNIPSALVRHAKEFYRKKSGS